MADDETFPEPDSASGDDDPYEYRGHSQTADVERL
jgi:hypothetical protein